MELEARKAASTTSMLPITTTTLPAVHFQMKRATTIASMHSITIVAATAMP